MKTAQDYITKNDLPTSGIVLFWDGLPFGWTKDLSRPSDNRPGVIGIREREKFIAVGGGAQCVAERWKPAVDLHCRNCGKTIIVERGDEEPENCATVEMSCEDCSADGERQLIYYFDANHRQITCDGSLIG